jgi:preprotein translocase subunit SecF
MGVVHRLYHGETAFPLIKERKRFYAASLILCLIAFGSLVFRGLNLGVEFKGGAIFTVSAPSNVDVHASRQFVESLGVKEAIVQTVKTSNGQTKLRVETEPLTAEQEDRVVQGLADRFHVDANTEIDSRDVGASWGKQVTRKAINGLIAFLIGVTIFISLRFEPKMAAAAMIALVHDLLLAAGIYSITHFVVTPSTIIALLTVLGYSLYDTIVVFDRVDENTKGIERGNKSTYSEAAELAVNQTFMRSINTSMIALLPVSGLLFVGALLLGAGTLKDLALALFVGLASGAYSSLFLATPLLADLKEREPRFQALQGRVAQRRSGAPTSTVRLSQRSVNAQPPEEGAEPAAEDSAVSTTTATAVRRPPPGRKPKSKKGGRPNRPSGKRKR